MKVLCGPEKKRRFLSRRRFVLRKCPVTDKYSHDLIAKKNAPMVRSAIARARGVDVLAFILMRTHAGMAFCLLAGGSSFW